MEWIEFTEVPPEEGYWVVYDPRDKGYEFCHVRPNPAASYKKLGIFDPDEGEYGPAYSLGDRGHLGLKIVEPATGETK